MRRNVILLAAAVLSVLLASSAAQAADFTVSITPSTLNAGTDSLLVNFTISNPSVDVAQVSIALPTGWVDYVSDPGSTSTSSSFSLSPMPSWSNTSTAPLIASGGTGYFWFRVTTPTTAASYPFNTSTTDSAGAYVSNNVSVTVQDMSAPDFKANSTSPSAPKYGPAKNYTFNATCKDNVAMAWVKFEWNGTDNYTNIGGPVENQSSDRYGITLTDLLTGNYTWKWFARDTSNNESATGLGVYNITKAGNPVVIYFNGNAVSSYTINQGNDINVTATGRGVALFQDGTLTQYNPYIVRLPIGSYAFKANATGDANYSANETGVTWTLRVIAPPPSYSVSTTIPTTWYLNAFALFNVTWSDLNDANAFSVALIRLNHTGTATNYTMTRITGTNKSTYALNITQPMVLSWRVFANNSAGSWNATTLTESTIAKITPNLTLSVVPDWDVLRGVQTSVACASPDITVTLYRNGVSVSNPDIQTLATGYYVYVCNNTATTNYSTYSVTKMLRVLSYAADVSFTKVDTLVIVTRNSTNSTTVVVKNVGNATQPVNITIDNITSSWYKLNATTVNVVSGYTTAFLVNFTPPVTADIKDYAGVFRAMTTNRTITSGFVLRVLPMPYDQTNITSQLSAYRTSVESLLEEISEVKENAGVTNQTSSEQKALEAKQKIEQAEGYMAAGDYFNAQQLFNSIETLIAGAVSDLAAEKQATETQETQDQQVQKTEWTTWIIVAAVAIAVLVLAYLLWPGRGYSPRTSSYTFKSPAERSKEAVSELKGRIESLGSNIPGVPKKSFAPQKLQSQVPPLRYPSYEPQLYRPKPVGYSFRPKPMVPVAGRFAAQQPPLKLAKPSFLEAVAQKLSSIKDMFKPKKEEVELGEQ
jgi:hypothetical protein